MHRTLLFILLLSLTACETSFIPEPIPGAEQIVAEGYVEAGENAAPTYVILTNSLPFFSEINQETFNDIYVRDATVTVSDGTNEVRLTELCLSELEGELLEIASAFLGFDASVVEAEFCLYIDLARELTPQVGETYRLRIETDTETLTASTTIPPHVPLDSLYFVPTPGEPSDTLVQLIGELQDPPGEPNFYRYFTQINGGRTFAPISSVTDDRLFDGQYFAFPIGKAETRETEFDPTEYGFFTKGDTVRLRWVNMDKEHFDFWNTLEFNALNQGPFSSYTRVASNIEGNAIGIWGGYSVSYYDLTAEE